MTTTRQGDGTRSRRVSSSSTRAKTISTRSTSRDSGRHEQPERPVRVPGQPRRAARTGDRERGDWAFTATTPRSASAHSRSGGRSRPTSSCRIPGSRRASLPSKAASAGASGRPGTRPPTTSRTSIQRFYDPSRAAVINPATGPARRRRSLQRHRAPGRWLRGRGQRSRSSRQDPSVQALFRGEPRGFSEMHYNVDSSRGSAVAYSLNEKTSFVPAPASSTTASTLNDSTILGGNPPFQPMVTVANGLVDNCRRRRGRAATDLPFGNAGARRRVQAPDVVHVVGRRRSAKFRSASFST